MTTTDVVAPSGVSIAGGSTITTNDDTPTVTVNVANLANAEDGATVELLVNGGVVASSTLTAGATSAAIALPTTNDGTYDLVARVTDVAGNVTTTAATDLIVDTVAPADTTITVAGESNGLNATEATATTAVTLSLASDASFVSAKIGTTDLTQVTLGSAYTFDATGLAEGDHVITVVSQDAGGNQTTTTKTVSIDTAVPAGTTVSAVSSDNFVNTAEKAEGITVSGTAEADSSVAITWGGVTRTTTTDGDGNWSLAYSSAQVPTDQSDISVTATDAAGNPSASPTTHSVTIDTAAPSGATEFALTVDNANNNYGIGTG